MNFKKLICVLSSLTISLSSFATYNNVKGAEFNLDDVYKNIYIPNGKKNCCWVSSGVSYLKYMFSKFFKIFGEKDGCCSPLMSSILKKAFIENCDKESFDNDKKQNIFRELWVIQHIIEKITHKSYNIEHYINVENKWGHFFYNGRTLETYKNIENDVYTFNKYVLTMDSNKLQEIIKKYISSEIPLICNLDLSKLLPKYVKEPENHAILITGYKTDDSTQNITHVICNFLISDLNTKLAIPINKLLDACNTISGISDVC